MPLASPQTPLGGSSFPRSFPRSGPSGPGPSGEGASTPPTATGSRAYSTSYPGSTNTTPGAGTAAPLSPTDSLVAQYNQWVMGQAQQGQGNYLGQVGISGAINQNNIAAANQSADSDLARLLQQQFRDVTLGRAGNAVDRAGIAANRGFVDRGYGLDTAGNLLTRDVNLRANLSDASSRGAISSAGYTQGNHDIQDKYNLANSSADLSRDKSMSDLDQQGKKLDINDQALASLGKEYGIRAADIKNQLGIQIQKLGLDYYQTVDKLNTQLNSGNAALQQQAYNFMLQVLAMPDTATATSSSYPGLNSANGPGVVGSAIGTVGAQSPLTASGNAGPGVAAAEPTVLTKLPNGTYAQVPQSKVNDQAYLASLAGSGA